MNDAARLQQLMDLRCSPVAIKFLSSPPADVPRIEAPAVSSCRYWKLAAEGQTFFTDATDHFSCPIGAYTHGVELPETAVSELAGLIDTMVELRYLSRDEVAEIPTRNGGFDFAIYAPLETADFDPDVVIVVGTPRQMMLLAEAAHAAGVAEDSSGVGRPTCAAIPTALQFGNVALNFGCIGNRIYTELPDEELVAVLAGTRLASIVKNLETIVHANNQLAEFHQRRFTSAG